MSCYVTLIKSFQSSHKETYAAAKTDVTPSAIFLAPPTPSTGLPVDPGSQFTFFGQYPILSLFPTMVTSYVPSGTQYKLS